MSPREHIDEMKRQLGSPSREARFWDDATQGERKYLLHSAGHPRHRINPAARLCYEQLDTAAQNAAGRGYSSVMQWAERVAEKGLVVEI